MSKIIMGMTDILTIKALPFLSISRPPVRAIKAAMTVPGKMTRLIAAASAACISANISGSMNGMPKQSMPNMTVITKRMENCLFANMDSCRKGCFERRIQNINATISKAVTRTIHKFKSVNVSISEATVSSSRPPPNQSIRVSGWSGKASPRRL